MDTANSDLGKAMSEGDLTRTNYYAQRIERLVSHNVEFINLARGLVPIFLDSDSYLPAADLPKVMRSLSPDISGADITQFVHDAKQSGFLALSHDKIAYTMLIPSLARHLLGEG